MEMRGSVARRGSSGAASGRQLRRTSRGLVIAAQILLEPQKALTRKCALPHVGLRREKCPLGSGSNVEELKRPKDGCDPGKDGDHERIRLSLSTDRCGPAGGPRDTG